MLRTELCAPSYIGMKGVAYWDSVDCLLLVERLMRPLSVVFGQMVEFKMLCAEK